MKKLHILFFLCLIGVSVAWGQSKMSLIDFRCDESDLTANTHGTERMDLNGEKCALIKIETTQKGFVFDCGSSVMPREVLYKPGQVWLYVPRGVKKLNISHVRLGYLEYVFPMPIEKARTYKVTLTAQNVAEIETSESVSVTLSVKNNVSAEIWVDGKKLGTRTWSGTLKSGKYTVECRKENCYPSKMEISVYAAEGGELTFKLTPPPPIMSSLSVITTPSGARIWVDGEDKGLSPKNNLSVSVGSHRIRLQHYGYESKEFTVNVERGKTKYVNETLSPFTDVEIKLYALKHKHSRQGYSLAGTYAFVTVDGNRQGAYSPISKRIAFGQHTFEAKTTYQGRSYSGQEIININTPNQGVELWLKPYGLYELNDVFYMDYSFLASFYPLGLGGGFSMGGYTKNDVNIEVWVSCLVMENENLGMHCGLKMGYGLQIGSKICFTPQAGLGWRWVDGHAFTVDAALRFSIGRRFLRFLLIPECGFILASTDNYPRWSKAWRLNVGLRIGWSFTF